MTPRTLILLTMLVGCGSEPSAPPSEAPSKKSSPESAKSQPSEPVKSADESGPNVTELHLSDFEPFPINNSSWEEKTEGGVAELVCSGKPKGYLWSKKTFRNFVWNAEFRFDPIAALPSETAEDTEARRNLCNTGFMIHIQEPHKVWPKSYEVQGKQVEMCQIKSNGGAAALETTDDAAARESARKPVGEWNQVEIVSQDGQLTATLNGKVIAKSQPGELSSGRIGLQSENFPVRFRNLQLRELVANDAHVNILHSVESRPRVDPERHKISPFCQNFPISRIRSEKSGQFALLSRAPIR